MCCFFTTLMLLGPRMAFLIYWLIPSGRLRVDAGIQDMCRHNAVQAVMNEAFKGNEVLQFKIGKGARVLGQTVV